MWSGLRPSQKHDILEKIKDRKSKTGEQKFYAR